jgi:aspartate aminotransferase
VRTTADADYKLTAAQLKEAITERTKLLILCSPNNPTGSVYTKEEIAGLVEVLKANPNIFVIVDEIYSAIVFYGANDLASEGMSELGERIIAINGVSKAYAMTGYRIGWMACHNKEVVKACDTLQGQYLTCACIVAQKAAEAALIGSQECVAEMRKEYAKRRELILSLLNEIPDVTYIEPNGAFYVFPDVSKHYGSSFSERKIANSDDMVNYLLDEAHVACVAGSAYGEDACIRLSFATNEANIREGVKRIKEALHQLK